MTESIIVAGLSLVGTLAGSYFAQRKATALIAYRIEQLEKKVSKHNNLVERMVVVEQSTKSAHHRIDHLESEVKNE